jgi:hypothetical protein
MSASKACCEAGPWADLWRDSKYGYFRADHGPPNNQTATDAPSDGHFPIMLITERPLIGQHFDGSVKLVTIPDSHAIDDFGLRESTVFDELVEL